MYVSDLRVFSTGGMGGYPPTSQNFAHPPTWENSLSRLAPTKFLFLPTKGYFPPTK